MDGGDHNAKDINSGTYMSLEMAQEDLNHHEGDSPLSAKVHEMRTLSSGEKSHLLVEDSAPTDDFSDTKEEEEEETFWGIAIQVFIPFLIAGMGMVGAGLVLDVVQVCCIVFLL